MTHTNSAPSTRAISTSIMTGCLKISRRHDSIGIKNPENTRSPVRIFSDVRGCQAKVRLVVFPARSQLRTVHVRTQGRMLSRKIPMLTSLFLQSLCNISNAITNVTTSASPAKRVRQAMPTNVPQAISHNQPSVRLQVHRLDRPASLTADLSGKGWVLPL